MSSASYRCLQVLPLVLLLCLVACEGSRPPDAQLTTIRIAGTPHQDTTFYMWGANHGAFRKHGIALDVRDTTWNDQLELAAGGGTDLSMATVDELAAKSKNLTNANRRVLYVMPAWLFEGQIFVSRPNLQSLAELKQRLPDKDAARQFFKQLEGKKIAVPEGSSYDQALRRLMKTSGVDPQSFRFINAELEAGINGLNDAQVGIAAAGIVERPEAERRGYKVALSSLDLEMIVIAGFICNAKFYETHIAAVDGFLSAWFESVAGALANPKEHYDIFQSYLSRRGAKPVTYEEYQRALKYTRFAKTLKEVDDTFLQPTSPSFWRKPWDQRVETLRSSGQADQAPLSTADFIADVVIKRVMSK